MDSWILFAIGIGLYAYYLFFMNCLEMCVNYGFWSGCKVLPILAGILVLSGILNWLLKGKEPHPMEES